MKDNMEEFDNTAEKEGKVATTLTKQQVEEYKKRLREGKKHQNKTVIQTVAYSVLTSLLRNPSVYMALSDDPENVMTTDAVIEKSFEIADKFTKRAGLLEDLTEDEIDRQASSVITNISPELIKTLS